MLGINGRLTVSIGILTLTCAWLAGCGGSTSLSSSLGNADYALLFGATSSWPRVVDAELNDQFDMATYAIQAEGQLVIQGEIEADDDIDVYDLGAVNIGDRILVSTAVTGGLDATLAVFDADQNLIYANDDYSWGVDNRPFVDVVVRRNTDT